MKLRISGVFASLILLAGCQGGDAGSRHAASTDAGIRPLASTSASLPRPREGVSIANAPDRGALVSYRNDGKPARREGAYTWYPVAISEAHAIKAMVSGQMAVRAPDGSQVKLRYERHEEHPDGNWTWVGRVEGGDPNQEAIFTFGERAVYGLIPQARGPALRLETRGGALWLIQTDPSKAGDPDTAETDIMLPPVHELRAGATAQASDATIASAPALQSRLTAGAPPNASNTIDLVIGYTPGFAAAQGSASAAVTRLTFLVQVGNQAFGNSQIHGHLRMVKAVEVNYADNTKNADALDQLTGHKEAVPESLAPLRAARDAYGGDIAILVRKFNTPENGSCGVAWLNGYNQRPINPATDAAFGYAVVSDGRDQDTAGTSYFCRERTLVHEVAHVMGSAHDRDNSRSDNGDLQYGRYAYSFGMKTDAANGNFYSVMAYGSSGQTEYLVFSNPDVTFCGGRACGVADETDNARSLNQTIPVVSGFRAAVVPFASLLQDDSNGDGRSDIFWNNPVQGGLQRWLMNGTTWSYSTLDAVGSQYQVAGIGDFDGDGLSDILWQDQARTEFWQWRGRATGGYDVVYLRSYPTGWNMVGVGDANGDGRADVFWHNPSQGVLQIWLMNGATWTYGAPNPVGTQYRVGAIGDFNDDGRADIIWHDTGKTTLYQWQAKSDGGYNVAYLRGYPAGWDIVGVGSTNQDGRADVYWHNGTQGIVQTWLMNGTTWAYGAPLPVGTQYRVADIGDFNGDGLSDLVWHDQAMTMLYQWRAQAAGGYDTVYLGNYPAGWEIAR